MDCPIGVSWFWSALTSANVALWFASAFASARMRASCSWICQTPKIRAATTNAASTGRTACLRNSQGFINAELHRRALARFDNGLAWYDAILSGSQVHVIHLEDKYRETPP